MTSRHANTNAQRPRHHVNGATILTVNELDIDIPSTFLPNASHTPRRIHCQANSAENCSSEWTRRQSFQLPLCSRYVTSHSHRDIAITQAGNIHDKALTPAVRRRPRTISILSPTSLQLSSSHKNPWIVSTASSASNPGYFYRSQAQILVTKLHNHLLIFRQ
jgi:hypothetical protein